MNLYSNISEQRHYFIGVDFVKLEGDKIVSYLDDIEEDEDVNPRVILLTLNDVESLNKWKNKISTKKLFNEVFKNLKSEPERWQAINLRNYIINVARKSKNNNIKHHPNINSLDNHHIDIITHNHKKTEEKKEC